MKGKNIYYPMGWDDNGLPTERRVQNYYNVWCSETAPYEPSLELELDINDKKALRRTISRKNFIELCSKVTKMDEIQFRELFTRVGLSVDWNEEYTTMNNFSRRSAQLSFLKFLSDEMVYQSSRPVLWDVDFQTAIAQAEVEDKMEEGIFYKIEFGIFGESGSFIIATTRPELLASCVAVAAHPDDIRYKNLFGKNAITPLFYASVPIIASADVEKDKGTGILMICTFGDLMDVEWWKEFKLPLKQIVGRNGKMNQIKFVSQNIENNSEYDTNFNSINSEKANYYYSQIEKKTISESRKIIINLLSTVEASATNSNPRKPLVEISPPILHSVKYFEKGNKPLEIISTRQWFLSLLDKKQNLLQQASKVKWNPEFMVKKYNDWVEGLNSDWCISRQRFFGVPFPIFYKIDSNGQVLYNNYIIPNYDSLPIDPMFDVPHGFQESERGMPNGFIGESYVFDTWWTSSLTPQIVTGWLGDDKKHQKLFPLSLRPQSHEIIRTWAFYTIVKSFLHEDSIPWKEIVISGWILDKDGTKISKTKGNSPITPMQLLDKYFADGIRYWAGLSRLGTDTKFDIAQLAVGRKLVTKIYNAGKLCFSYGPIRGDAVIKNDLDLSILAQLDSLVTQCNDYFSNHNFSKALREIEIFFWTRFTDYYLEMIKQRANENNVDVLSRESAIITMRFIMNVLLRLFAPFLPHITEEVWSWVLASSTNIKTIHIAPYPTISEFEYIKQFNDVNLKNIYFSKMESVICCVDALRKCKADHGLNFSFQVESFSIKMNISDYNNLEHIWDDISYALRTKKILAEVDQNLEKGTLLVSINNPKQN